MHELAYTKKKAFFIDFFAGLWQIYVMLRWRIPRWRVGALSAFLLIGLIILILYIVWLPDVDIPDAAFHRGTAPLSLRALGTSVPLILVVAVLNLLIVLRELFARIDFPLAYELSLTPNSRPILLRTIRR